jgi:hypothetical protein
MAIGASCHSPQAGAGASFAPVARTLRNTQLGEVAEWPMAPPEGMGHLAAIRPRIVKVQIRALTKKAASDPEPTC